LIAEGIGRRVKRRRILRTSTPEQTFVGTPHGSELRFEMRSKISEPQVQVRNPVISLTRTIRHIASNSREWSDFHNASSTNGKSEGRRGFNEECWKRIPFGPCGLKYGLEKLKSAERAEGVMAGGCTGHPLSK
jgi:hypothetical protein